MFRHMLHRQYLIPKPLKDEHINHMGILPNSYFATAAQLGVLGVWWLKEMGILIVEYTGMGLY